MLLFYKSKKGIAIAISCILVCCMSAAGVVMAIQNKGDLLPPSSQSDYPVLPDPHALIQMADFNSVEKITQYSDLVIQGTIINEISTPETEIVAPKPGTAEAEILKKNGQAGYSITTYRYKVHINDVLKGNSDTSEITLCRSSITADAEPVLEKDQKMILFLRFKDNGEYIIMAPHEGYYYVAHDEKVYPVEVTQSLQNTSGMSLSKFKKQIRDYANQ